jgi:hypothetical protein
MMKLKQTQLLTLESYVEALRNKEFAGSNHPMVGDSCIGGGNFVVMGN